MVSCARATRTIRMCSLDARSGRPIGPPALEGRREQAWRDLYILGRAQWETNRATRLRGVIRASSEGAFVARPAGQESCGPCCVSYGTTKPCKSCIVSFRELTPTASES
jgi:hypothetical protein